MANKHFFQPRRMESQSVVTKMWTVIASVDLNDGALVTLGDFTTDPVYSARYTALKAPVDFNTRTAALTTADATGVYVIDLASIATKSGMGNTIRDGYNTIGLTAKSGTPIRARKLVPEDTFSIGEENCTAALVKGQFAGIAADGKFKPSATAPANGAVLKVVDKYVVSQGVDGDVTTGRGVTAYTLMVVSN